MTDEMRAAVLVGPRRIVLEDRPRPRPGTGEVLIRVAAVGVCGSDVHYFREGRIGDHVVDQPLVLGHEASGLVEAIGAGVSDTWLGTRVAIEPGVPDEVCDQCRSGRYNLCPAMRFFATPPYDGALVEYLVHPVDFVYALPESVSDAAGGLVEPLSVGIWACRRGDVGPGTSVLIAGAGPVGLLTMQVAKSLGARDVTISDLSSSRLQLADQLGADHVLTPEESSPVQEYDVFIDCSGVADAIRTGIGAVRPGGAVVLVGLGLDEVTVPMVVLQDQEITVRGVFRYADTWPEAIRLIADGKIDVDTLVTSHHQLDETAEALSILPDEGLKAVIYP